jgi:pyrroloquinoline-quinone synthase
MGASHDEVMKAKGLAETTHLVNTFYHLAERDWRDGLCALFAYEYQVPAVSASKIAGLKEHYGIDDEKTLEFFVAHQAYDVEHANQVATLIEEHTDKDAACIATREAARALWTFLDGMCREHEIVCH